MTSWSGVRDMRDRSESERQSARGLLQLGEVDPRDRNGRADATDAHTACATCSNMDPASQW